MASWGAMRSRLGWLVPFPLLLLVLPQSTSPPHAGRAEVLEQLDRYLAAVGSDDGRQALALVEATIERDYRAVFAAWQAEPAGRRRECLEHLLQLPAARAAATVLVGTLAGATTDQAGVVDSHTLRARFTELEVLRAPERERRDLKEGTFLVLRGTSRDAWLAAQLRANLERVVAPRVWLFTLQPLLHPAPAGEPGTSLEIQEWTTLPAAAAPCLRQVLH